MSSFKVMMTNSTDMVMVLKVSCDRKSLYLPVMKSLNFQRESAKKKCFYLFQCTMNINNTDMCFRLKLLKPTGHVMHQQFNIQQLYLLPTLYLCVLYLSENKQRLVPLIS
jgi:hypothetical protein